MLVAAAPGFLLGLLALRLPEPERGAADPHLVAREHKAVEAVRRVTGAEHA